MSALVAPIGAAPAGRAERSPLRPALLGLAVFVALAHAEAAVQAAGSAPGLAAGLAGVSAGWGIWAAGVLTGRRTPSRGALAGAAAAALSLAVVWLCSRTTGLPGLSPRAPVGPLDAATCVDELLLAAGALRLLIGGGGLRAQGPLAAAAFVAVAFSLMLLSMGCDVGRAAAGPHVTWGAGDGARLFCHLF